MQSDIEIPDQRDQILHQQNLIWTKTKKVSIDKINLKLELNIFQCVAGVD